MKLWAVDFADKRRVQRRMSAETKQEVINYIFSKYGSGFSVSEVKE